MLEDIKLYDGGFMFILGMIVSFIIMIFFMILSYSPRTPYEYKLGGCEILGSKYVGNNFCVKEKKVIYEFKK